MPVPLLAGANDTAVCRVHRREQRCSSVALIIVGHCRTSTFLDGKAGLGAVQRLDRTFLVTAQHDCILWRRQIKANDVFEFFLEVLVIGKLEGCCHMRLQSVCRPNATDC